MNFEVNLILLIRPFFLHGQEVVINLKYLEKGPEEGKELSDEIKSIFHHF